MTTGRLMAVGFGGLATLMLAGIVHIAALLIMPQVATQDAFRRIAAFAAEGQVRALPRASSVTADPIPSRDPAIAAAVCRYDLGSGPLRVSATVDDQAMVAVSLHGRTGSAFYGLDDRAADAGRLDLVVMTREQYDAAVARDSQDVPVRDVRVVAPDTRGFVLFDVLARVGGYAAAERGLGSMRCEVER